ncbi:peptidyl-prolyl cis-trans isomerase [Aspergillus arachidicola]|uniref:Peptidyl-prolyl isomerase CWC27 n=1 Tax=Aspergillus arachidicola TaxID=656916 RepID=A0A2G7GBT4_9EURO|nr:peptidyl-prolyl cis-trans isomerase [Aspergillus arachidicola]
MSAHYATEPNPTASATINTTFGPLHISLFATQTPLTCRNFLQHCQDGYYTDTIFHRVVPGFIIQGGDPTGTGSGGTSIYEDPEFEYDPEARDPNEKVVLRDELHSRLRYNRRGLVGMAKSEDGSYGSQFFITLGNTERELNGQCTLFGRIEGDSIYNMVKIAEAERVEGTERPVYPVKITSCEIGELGPLAGKIKKRQITATRTAKTEDKPAPKKKKKNKGGKTLLSFGDDGDADEDMPIRPAKPKFNSKPETQLPLPKPESPDRSPSPAPAPAPKQSFLSRTNAEIANLKASMRRTAHTGPADTGHKKSALEAMIPETAIRGRKRPPPGTSASTNSSNGITGFSSSADNETLKLLNAFKAKLESADSPDDEEAQLCDLHFIANCQSCKSWDDDQTADGGKAGVAAEDEEGWLTHELRFGKDTLGKDLNWKREHQDADSLMVIDPREKEKEYVGGKRRGLERDRERDRKRERAGNLEWDKARRGK